MGRLAATVFCAIAAVAPSVDAAWLSLDAPAQVAAGWTRIAGRYGSVGVEPTFRAIARCGRAETDVQVPDPHVYVARAESALWVDLPGKPDRLVPGVAPCEAPEVSIEMLVGTTVVASAPVPRREGMAKDLPVSFLAAPPPPVRPASRLSLNGQKYAAPFGKRTEAGVAWSLDSRVSIQLNYERTSQAPMMPFDHDDGILTRLRVGF